MADFDHEYANVKPLPADTYIYTPKVILITGGAGFIGSNVANHLISAYPSYKIVVLDILDRCSSLHNLIQHPNLQFHKGDICDSTLVYNLIRSHSVDTIMHFAAQSHVDNSFGDSLAFTEANVLGTHVMLEAAKVFQPQIRRFIHVSTDEVYGEQLVDQRVNEDARQNPTNPYAASKSAAETLVQSYIHSFQLPIIITRSNNIYGPRQYPEKLIPKFIWRLRQGLPATIHGTGQNRRSYVYVTDIARAFDVLLHRAPSLSVYNIGSDDEFQNIQIFNKLLAIMKAKGYCQENKEYVTFVRDRAFNDFRYYITTDSLRSLGWARQIDMDQGLELTVRWYLSHCSPSTHWSSDALAIAIDAHPHFPLQVRAVGPIPDEEQHRQVLAPLLTSASLAEALAATTTTTTITTTDSSSSTSSSSAASTTVLTTTTCSNGATLVTPSPATLNSSTQSVSGATLGFTTPPLCHSRSSMTASSNFPTTSSITLRWLVYGHQGWLGAQFVGYLRKLRPDDVVITPMTRVDCEDAVAHDIEQHRPHRVVSMIGRLIGPGFNNVDYLEQKGKLQENLRDNLQAPIELAIVCSRYHVHFTYLGTGCIFTHDAQHPPARTIKVKKLANGTASNAGEQEDEEEVEEVLPAVGFSESDHPNFTGATYSVVKGITDRLMHLFASSTLNVRIRLPINTVDEKRNLLSKLIRYSKIANAPNSITVVNELWPILIDMIVAKQTGTLNLTNPGTIEHNEILQLYKELVEPEHKWTVITPQEQTQFLAAERCNVMLTTERLQNFQPKVRSIHEAMRDVIVQFKFNREHGVTDNIQPFLHPTATQHGRSASRLSVSSTSSVSASASASSATTSSASNSST